MPKRRRTALRSLLAGPALALVLAASGCSSQAAPGAVAAPGAELTLAHAREIVNTFTTADDVARAAGDEPLAVSLVGGAQLPLTVSAYERADYSGTPATRYRFGIPQLYVPALKTYPLWFAAVAPRTPSQGGPTQTAIMAFSRATPDDTWQLSVLTLLRPGVALPRISVDRSGHAIALATFDKSLLASPNSVGALQSALADDGPASAAATIVAAGPYTTGLYSQAVAARQQAAVAKVHFETMVGQTSFPIYALATADGGSLVLYSLSRSSVVTQHGSSSLIDIPPAFAPLLYATGRLIVQSELDTGETYEYAAYVPSAKAAGGNKVVVIASDGGATSATGT